MILARAAQGRRYGEEDLRAAALRPVVDAGRPALLRPPLARHADGLRPGGLQGKPIIGILNTWSDAQPVPRALQGARRGREARRAAGRRLRRRAAGAVAVDESFTKPTSMLYRNMLAMETEEMIRSPPGRRRGADGRLRQDHARPRHGRDLRRASRSSTCPPGRCCAATTPGEYLGSGSDAWKYWDERRAGNITDEEWLGIEGGIARSDGHCMTMGTASTMTAITEAMGLTLPGASSIPAADAGHQRMARRLRPPHRRDGLGGPDAGQDRHRRSGARTR